ncbi:MAG: hypothetical protein HS099_16290 [Ardenticatenaceae bacterium]|nr:hypothetical protein [Ardenticatenaceae bacterium]
MRIIHPNHPLVGQTAVIKRILPATHRQPARYLIHHPQTGTVNIPQAWAISAPDTARHELADMAESLPAAPTATAPIPLVTLHTLLALAKLVQTMQAQAPEETHDPTPTAPAPHLGEPAPTRQQELSHLLAALLTQYLTAHKAAHKHQATSQPPQEETTHERTPQNP